MGGNQSCLQKIEFEKHFYANTGLTILDENAVVFGDDAFLRPHVSIYTAGHSLSAEVRNLELEYAFIKRLSFQ